MSALSSSEEDKEKAMSLKDLGNTALQSFRYSEAADLYTEALELFESSVLYSNRAMAYIRMEQYGLAIIDADASIAFDAEYVKAYYRRGSAQFALGKNKLAKKSFKIGEGCTEERCGERSWAERGDKRRGCLPLAPSCSASCQPNINVAL